MAVTASLLGIGSVQADQTATEFTTTLTGVLANDTAYKNAGVTSEDGQYVFSKNSSITADNAINIANGIGHDVAINASGRTLNLKGSQYGIHLGEGTNATIKAGTVNFDMSELSDTTKAQLAAGIYVEKDANLTLTGSVTGTLMGKSESSDESQYHAALYSKGNLTVNGSVNFTKDGGYGVSNNNKETYAVGLETIDAGTLTVNGRLDMTVDGTGIQTKGGTVNVKCGSLVTSGISTVGDDEWPTTTAINTMSGGTVNFNMNTSLTDSATTWSEMYGDAYAAHVNKPLKENSIINLGFANSTAKWTGVAFNPKADDGAEINLYLKSGATWKNESVSLYFGELITDVKSMGKSLYTGSRLTKLSGGTTEAMAGHIYQNDTNPITVDNYSGFTNVYYTHENAGTDVADYTGGNTIIKAAESGSQITLITDATGIDTANEDTAKSVLNALAQKLYYKNIATDSNLVGKVKISDGLTSSSWVHWIGDVAFNVIDGQGALKTDSATTNDFTRSITGVKATDTAYVDAEILTDEGENYNFKGDAYIKAKTAVNLAATLDHAVNINANGYTLTLDGSATSGTLNELSVQSTKGTTVKAKTLDVRAIGTGRATVRGIYTYGRTADAVTLDVTGNTNITAQAESQTAHGIYAFGNSEVKITGNLSASGTDANEWGISTEKTGNGYDTSALIYTYKYLNGSDMYGPKVTVTGNVNAKVKAHGLLAYGGNGNITVSGGGSLEVDKDNTHPYYALIAQSATTSLNVATDEEGNVTAAGTKDLVLKGNVNASAYAVVANETGETSTVNLGLPTKASEWWGVAYNEFGDEGKIAGEKTFKGAINVWLQNGASWHNEAWGTVTATKSGTSEAFAGSHVANLVGGKSATMVGNIFQNDTQSLTIDNLSGYTNVYYAHKNAGQNVSDYTAGDTIVKAAEEGAQISLITDNTGIDTKDETAANDTLNALAQKLYYKNIATDSNLVGKVKIADGLTASSVAMWAADVSFNETSGQGYLKTDTTRPEYGTTITGVKANDQYYVDAGILKDEGEHYVFTRDATLTSNRDSTSTGTTAAVNIASDVGHAVDIKAEGHTITINSTSSGDSGNHYGIAANSLEGTTITADKLVINAISDKGRIEAFNVGGQGQQNADNPNKLTVNGDLDLNVQGIGYTLGLYAAGNSEITFNGNVTARDRDGYDWGLYARDGAWGYYGCSLIYSGNNYTLQMGPKVTINGDINAKIDGNGVMSNGGHAKISFNGGGYLEINKDNTHNYYALLAECATTSMNVNLDEKYIATSARDNKLVLKGNVSASSGAINVNEPELYTYVNLGLATKDSEWTGVAYNKFPDAGKTLSGKTYSGESVTKTFYGAINVFLQNGAKWNNEAWGAVETNAWGAEPWSGSHLAKLVGGTSEAAAGNIFQKDANPLTIDNISGYTNVYYAHEGNGEATENYTAGDTVIKAAAAGSQVSVITDNTGIDMEKSDSVNKVLNALAGKIYYKNYVTGERNLTGYVKIADGLTASSAALKSETIMFKESNGQGSLYAENQTQEEYDQVITGDVADDSFYKKNGVLKDENNKNSYIFTINPTKISVDADAVVDAKEDVTLTANDAALTLDSTKDGGAGIATNGKKVTFAGKKLLASGATGVNANGGALSVTGEFNAEKAGMETGIVASASADVEVKGKTTISAATAINASGDDTKVTLKGETDITGTDTAISAGAGATVTVSGGKATVKGALEADGGSLTLGDNNGIYGQGDFSVSNDGEMVINIIGEKSKVSGGYDVQGGKLTINVKDGGTWALTDYITQTNARSLRALGSDGTTVLNGGESEDKAGNIEMEASEDQTVSGYSGYMNVFYQHTGNGESEENYTAGNLIIQKAEAGSHISLITNRDENVTYEEANVIKILNALAGKLYYSAYVDGEKNLTGQVKLAEGLTASAAILQMGDIEFQADKEGKGKGKYKDGSLTPGFDNDDDSGKDDSGKDDSGKDDSGKDDSGNKDQDSGNKDSGTISSGDYETYVMKGIRSAATTSFHAWRDNMQDIYRAADLADADGIFAKVLAGKTKSDVHGVNETNTYKGVQVGYNKALQSGWHTGVAFDYRDGDSDYLLGGKGDDKLYSFGLYGVKKLADNSYFRVAAKVGRVENKYDVYNEIRTTSLHGEYGVAAYGLTAEYGKTFGKADGYVTPKVQLTWAHVGGKDYTASTAKGATMDIYQDAYKSFVGRIGVEAGLQKATGNFYGGLYFAHEFSGDINSRYFAKDGGWKSTAFDGKDSWVELVLGGSFHAGTRTQIYANLARDFGGDFQHQWKLDAGVRYSF